MPRKKQDKPYPANAIVIGTGRPDEETVKVKHSNDGSGNLSFIIKIDHPWAGKMECTYTPDPTLRTLLWNYFVRLCRHVTDASNDNLALYCFFDARQILKGRVGPKLKDALEELIAEVQNRTIIANGLVPETKQIESFAEAIKIITKEKMGMKLGRPVETGYFRNEAAFLKALIDVLSEFKKQPSRPQVLLKLSHHKLWQGKEPLTLELCRARAKTLDNWLKKCELTWPLALENYYHPPNSGK